jgi:alpha-beta hydrolase superfamily lysophospholipase
VPGVAPAFVSLRVELARTCDREELRHALEARGFAVAEIDDEGRGALEVRPDGHADDRLEDELPAAVDAWTTENGLPFVSTRREGTLLVSPCGD